MLHWLAATAAAAAAAMLGFMSLKHFMLAPNRKLRQPNYTKDRVYLYNFASCPSIVSISPYGLKLETWLRMKQIPHETARTVYVWSSKGQIPFVELNGEEISESNLTIRRLARHFDVGDEHVLSQEQVAQAHVLGMMLESHTVFSYFYYRYAEDTVNFVHEWKFTFKLLRMWLHFAFPRSFLKRIKAHGIGSGSIAEVYQLGNKDLAALSTFLGDKQFLFGDKMTTADCYAFGHLAQILYLPLDYPHKRFLREQAVNLCEYTDRIRELMWPDWEQVCADNLGDA